MADAQFFFFRSMMMMMMIKTTFEIMGRMMCDGGWEGGKGGEKEKNVTLSFVCTSNTLHITSIDDFRLLLQNVINYRLSLLSLLLLWLLFFFFLQLKTINLAGKEKKNLWMISVIFHSRSIDRSIRVCFDIWIFFFFNNNNNFSIHVRSLIIFLKFRRRKRKKFKI